MNEQTKPSKPLLFAILVQAPDLESLRRMLVAGRPDTFAMSIKPVRYDTQHASVEEGSGSVKAT